MWRHLGVYYLPQHKYKLYHRFYHRHPNFNTKSFIEYLDKVLFELNTACKHYFILGDININTNIDQNQNLGFDYLNMLTANCISSIINQLTRVTPATISIVDHILNNECRYPLIPGVIKYDITNHFPVMVIVCRKICNQQDQIRYARSFSNFSPDTFNDELQQLINDYMNINDLHNTNVDNINILFDQFYFLVTKTIDKHALMETFLEERNVFSKTLGLPVLEVY